MCSRSLRGRRPAFCQDARPKPNRLANITANSAFGLLPTDPSGGRPQRCDFDLQQTEWISKKVYLMLCAVTPTNERNADD